MKKILRILKITVLSVLFSIVALVLALIIVVWSRVPYTIKEIEMEKTTYRFQRYKMCLTNCYHVCDCYTPYGCDWREAWTAFTADKIYDVYLKDEVLHIVVPSNRGVEIGYGVVPVAEQTYPGQMMYESRDQRFLIEVKK